MKHIIFGWNASGAYAANLLEQIKCESVLFNTAKPDNLPRNLTFTQYEKISEGLISSHVSEGDSVLLLDSKDMDFIFSVLARMYKKINVVIGAQKPFSPADIKTPFPVKIINPDVEAAKEMLRAMSGSKTIDPQKPSLWLKVISTKDRSEWIGLSLKEVKTQAEPLAVVGILVSGSPEKMTQDDAVIISEGDKIILAGPAEWFEGFKQKD